MPYRHACLYQRSRSCTKDCSYSIYYNQTDRLTPHLSQGSQECLLRSIKMGLRTGCFDNVPGLFHREMPFQHEIGRIKRWCAAMTIFAMDENLSSLTQDLLQCRCSG